MRFSVSRWQVISASIWAACISRYRWRRASRLRRGFFRAAGQQQRRRQQPYQAFFHGKPSFPEGFPLSQHLSVCHAARPDRYAPRRVRGSQAANQVRSIFRGGAPKGTSVGRVRREKILCAERVCPNEQRLIWTRGSEREPNLSKRAKLFWISLTRDPPAEPPGSVQQIRWGHAPQGPPPGRPGPRPVREATPRRSRRP